MAVIASQKPSNMVHIIINNGSHESVGGQPTVMNDVDISSLAKSVGYPDAISVENFDDLDKALIEAKKRNELTLIEVKTAIGARNDLGRPTTTAKNNKEMFMANII